MKQLLDYYARATGQTINPTKLGVLFSPNFQSQTMNIIKSLLDVYSMLENGRYLGLPSFVGKGKKSNFLLHKRAVVAQAHRLAKSIFLHGQ